MNLYAFIASITGSLAWPLLVAFLVWLLFSHGRIEKLVRTFRKYVKTVKVGSLELTVQDLREEAEEVAADLGKPLGSQSPPDDNLIKLAQANPAMAIVEIWKQLDAKIFELIHQKGMVQITRPSQFMEWLKDQKKISAIEFQLYQSLRQIRNDAVQSRDAQPLTVAEVLEFRDFVAALMARLERIKAESGRIDVANINDKPGA